MIEQDEHNDTISNTITSTKSLKDYANNEIEDYDINAQRKVAELYVKLHIANHRPG